MSKQIVTSANLDFIIDGYSTPIRNEQHKEVWVDEKNGIAKLKGAVHKVTFYQPSTSPRYPGHHVKVELTPTQIKALYDRIIEIENWQGEGFFEDMTLPF